jgi:hypothetical protein
MIKNKFSLATLTLYCKVNAMTTQQTALEHLRVIRSLLEKSQVYRAISAPAALCGGILALAAALITINVFSPPLAGRLDPKTFLSLWLAILVITSALNFYLLSREAASRSQPFFSEGMRMALRAFLPPMLVGGVLGICLIWYGADVNLASLIWILCYGLALLSTSHFSPRSLVRLGWAFVIVGMVLTIGYFAQLGFALPVSSPVPGSIFLGLTFGLLHIAYAIAVFIRKPATQKPEA